MRIAINGFGRIGRLSLRASLEAQQRESQKREAQKNDLEFVAINDLCDRATNAHLLRYDSTHGACPFEIGETQDEILVQGHKIKCLSERDPTRLPWAEMGVDIVFECTGLFTDSAMAKKHIEAGAKKVLISGPSPNADYTIVYGVNHRGLSKDHQVISNASCTTNCLAPVAYVLNQTCGIRNGHMTTIHAYTGDQAVLDIAHKDKRRARAANLSMIPTSTGAAKAIGLVLPELDGKIAGTSVRVPTPNVSMVDLVIQARDKTTIEEVNQAFITASQGQLKNLLCVSDEPLISIDFNHNPASSTIDLAETNVIDGELVRCLSWYDNEWGFANRMSDVAQIMIFD